MTLANAAILSYPKIGILASHAVFGDAVEGSARDILSDAEAPPEEAEEKGVLAEAKQFLLELLEDGPVAARKGFSESNDAGFSSSTINRAKRILNIESKKKGNRWFWHLPAQVAPQDDQDAHPNILSTLSTLVDDHVRIEI